MFLDKHFQANMQSLGSRNRILTDRIKGLAPDGSLELITAESGAPTIRQDIGKDASHFIHSRINPVKEAQHWAQHQNIQKKSIVILGFGVGYHVFELIKMQPHSGAIHIIEADESLFRLALSLSDFSSIIDSEHIHFLVGQDIIFLEQILSSSLLKPFSYHIFLPAISLYRQFYANVVSLLDELLFRSRLNGQKNNSSNGNIVFDGGIEKLISVLKSV